MISKSSYVKDYPYPNGHRYSPFEPTVTGGLDASQKQEEGPVIDTVTDRNHENLPCMW